MKPKSFKKEKKYKFVRIPAELHELIKSLHEKEDRSHAAIVQRAVELYAKVKYVA